MNVLKKVFIGLVMSLLLAAGGITAQSVLPQEVAPVSEAQAAVPFSELYRNYSYLGRGRAYGRTQGDGPRYVGVLCSGGRVYHSPTKYGAGTTVFAYCPWGQKAVNSTLTYNDKIIRWA